MAVLVSAIAGIPLAFTATGGPLATAGFLALNLVWVMATVVTILLARRRSLARHRAWAIRSYSVTFANMTLHLITASLSGLLDDHSTAYTIAVWLCWPVNLCIAEVAIRRRFARSNRT